MASQYLYNSAGSSGLGIKKIKLGPGDLLDNRVLGRGLASVGYKTKLFGEKCARKDFTGVPCGTFRREAARLVGLEDHINVVKTLGWTENNMSCSLVVEYMDDDLLGILDKWQWTQSRRSMEAVNSGYESDLDSTIKLAPFELPEALDLMLQIARGMEYLADKGIRHGNLKTKNVLVTRTRDRDGNSVSVKVSDFGLVRTRRKSAPHASRQTRKLDMVRWTAPELLEVFLLEDKGFASSESDSDEDCTDSSDLLGRDVPEWRELGADVYSFAVICSQILTGEDPYPYPNLNWKELGVKIVRHGLKPTLPAACPRELRELLASCWDFDHFSCSLRERPSFSRIRRSLERLIRLIRLIPAHHLHESLPLAEMSWERIGLQETLTVEALWGPEYLQCAAWRSLYLPPDMENIYSTYLQLLALDVASLIARTRTVVRCCTQWTQVREELQLMLPDVLKMRNRWVGYEKASDGKGFADLNIWTSLDGWARKLQDAVFSGLHEVQKLEDDNPSLLRGGEFPEPQRLSQCRKDINELAKVRKKALLDVTRALRRAQRVVKIECDQKYSCFHSN